MSRIKDDLPHRVSERVGVGLNEIAGARAHARPEGKEVHVRALDGGQHERRVGRADEGAVGHGAEGEVRAECGAVGGDKAEPGGDGGDGGKSVHFDGRPEGALWARRARYLVRWVCYKRAALIRCCDLIGKEKGNWAPRCIQETGMRNGDKTREDHRSRMRSAAVVINKQTKVLIGRDSIAHKSACENSGGVRTSKGYMNM